MYILEIIRKKRDGAELSSSEIEFFIRSYVAGDIPDYQVSALLMAVFFQGMTNRESSMLTREMINSGTTLSLPAALRPYVDKHSTGGVGDKVSLLLAPIIAANGVYVPMMSGRALGHTGGTLDKLDSIPGYSTQLSNQQFTTVLRSCGFAMTGQSRDIVPADRLLYALRDVTATVESIPLITASILSKKFAEGTDSLVFDVKTGRGAFMQQQADAERLAESLVRTARELGKSSRALITDMDIPLGRMVGNFLEVEESYRALLGEGPDDLMEVTHALAAAMLVSAGIADNAAHGAELSHAAIANRSALERFRQNITLQGGDPQAMEKMIGTYRAPVRQQVTAGQDGYIHAIDALEVGLAGIPLGVGRSRTTDAVYSDAGFSFAAHYGDVVKCGQSLCTVYGRDETAVQQAAGRVHKAIVIAPEPPPQRSMIRKEIIP